MFMRTLGVVMKSSHAELKDLRSLTVASFLAAVYAITYLPAIGRLIVIPGVFEIRVGFVVIAVSAALFGPVIGLLTALVGDIIGTILFSGVNFFWGFTFNWVILGFVFGLIFYKKNISIKRVIAAMLFNTCAVNMILSTKWLQMMGAGDFKSLFMIRIIPNMIMLPINTILLIFALRAICSAHDKFIANRA